MIKILAALSLIFAAGTANADLNKPLIDIAQFQASTMLQAETFGLDWKVGDKANYKIKISFLTGDMEMFVREFVTEGAWIEQNLDLLGQKQKVEMLIDPQTGEVIKVLVNGEKQEMPDPADQEVVEMEEANITVPAGTFDCIYVKVRNKKDNSESEAWINPEKVPVFGMIQQKAPSQMGEVIIELASFHKN